MSVFHECEIEWGGKALKFRPTMALLRRIEYGDENGPVSISKLTQDFFHGEPRAATMSWVMCQVLAAAGANVTEEDIYLFSNSDPQKFAALFVAILTAITPEDKKKKEKPQKSRKTG